MAKAKQLTGIHWFGYRKARKCYSRSNYPRLAKGYLQLLSTSKAAVSRPTGPDSGPYPIISSTTAATQLNRNYSVAETLRATLRLLDDIIASEGIGATDNAKSISHRYGSNIGPHEIDALLTAISAHHRDLCNDIFALTIWKARKEGSEVQLEDRLAGFTEIKVPSVDWEPELCSMFCLHCAKVHEVPTLKVVDQPYQVCPVWLKVV